MRSWDEIEKEQEKIKQDIILVRDGLHKSIALLDHVLGRMPKENQ